MRRRHLPFIATTAVVLLAVSPSHAEEHSIIKNFGDHPNYTFEAEPHLIVGFGDPFPGGGEPGIGFRGSFHLANGFVRTINDSIALGFGADFAGFGNITYVTIPVVMQWNFWLSTHWSVFGEPGIQITNQGSNWGPVLYLGGRYHFTETIALTLRVGWPALSVGISFFP